MKRKLKIIGLVSILLLATNQEGFSQIKLRTLRASFYNEALSLPTIRLLRAPIHPTITVGTDFWVKSGKHWQQSLGSDLTFYHHRLSENALIVDGIYSFGYKFGFGLQAKLIGGIGYKHSFVAGEVYKFEDGEYKKAINWGTSHFNVKVGLGFEFPLNEKFSATADYKFMIATPYSEALSFSTHTFIGVGFKIYLTNK